jgi:predicted peptidase
MRTTFVALRRLTAVAVLLAAGVTAAAEFGVAANGDDANPGTAEKPALVPQPMQMKVQFVSHVFTNPANHQEVLPYVVAAPSGNIGSKKRPLLVFLHGSGERGTDNQRQLIWARDWLEKAVREHNAVAVEPQCPSNCRWVEVDWGL